MMIKRSPARRSSGRLERGSFMLEALIAILIVAFGLLGLVGLHARVIQQVDDAQYRSEAVFMTNALIGQMWTSPMGTLSADFSSVPGTGAGYVEFRDWVQQRLPGASGRAPTVVLTPRPPGAAMDVTVTVFWKPPSELAVSPEHQFQATATIGQN
jgi:type IV pilus assembly protein PilV